MKRIAAIGLSLAILGAGPVLAQDKKDDQRRFTPISEMTDVTPDHWAYPAIKALVEKYQIMEGFPDGTFRGAKYITRYEAAAALAKVMARVEDMVVAAGAGEPTESSATSSGPVTRPLVSAEDLRTIARLQQEFKDELAAMSGRLDTFDQRLINLEKRLKLGGGLQVFYRIYTNAAYGLDTMRVATQLKLGADVAPELSYTGQLNLLNHGVHGFANGHLATDGGNYSVAPYYYDAGTPLYVRKSYLSWTPPSVALHAGMLSYGDVLPVGSAISSGFGTAPVWPLGEGGYGFVGTPPVQNGALKLYDRISSPGRGGRAPYHPGVNVVQDLLDPDSARDLNTGSAGGAALLGTLGPVELGVGLHNGVSGASTGLALHELPATYPLISQLNDGYGLVKAGVDLGIFRASVVGRADNSALGTIAGSLRAGKGAGGTIDLGNDAAGLSLGFAMMNRGRFDPNYYHEASLALSSNSILGLGIGAGIASKVGLAPISGFANPNPSLGEMGLRNEAGAAKTQKIPGLPYNWTSTGLYIKFPGFSLVPSLTLAAQTSGWDILDSNFGSGLSAIAEIQPHPALPRIFLQYDMGKFSADPRHWNALFGSPAKADAANPNPAGPSNITHEQFVFGTSVSF